MSHAGVPRRSFHQSLILCHIRRAENRTVGVQGFRLRGSEGSTGQSLNSNEERRTAKLPFSCDALCRWRTIRPVTASIYLIAEAGIEALMVTGPAELVRQITDIQQRTVERWHAEPVDNPY